LHSSAGAPLARSVHSAQVSYFIIPVPVLDVDELVELVVVVVVVVVDVVPVVVASPPVPPPPVPPPPVPVVDVLVVSELELLVVPDPQPAPEDASTPVTPSNPRPTFHHDEAIIPSLLSRKRPRRAP
jgi:hypothetical protein